MRVSEANGWPAALLKTAAVRVTSPSLGESDVESSFFDYYAAVLSGLAADKRERGTNVVITLNYDLILEEALRRLGIPISYALGDAVDFDAAAGIDESHKDALQVLKLHGRFRFSMQGLRTRSRARSRTSTYSAHLAENRGWSDSFSLGFGGSGNFEGNSHFDDWVLDTRYGPALQVFVRNGAQRQQLASHGSNRGSPGKRATSTV